MRAKREAEFSSRSPSSGLVNGCLAAPALEPVVADPVEEELGCRFLSRLRTSLVVLWALLLLLLLLLRVMKEDEKGRACLAEGHVSRDADRTHDRIKNDMPVYVCVELRSTVVCRSCRQAMRWWWKKILSVKKIKAQ